MHEPQVMQEPHEPKSPHAANAGSASSPAATKNNASLSISNHLFPLIFFRLNALPCFSVDAFRTRFARRAKGRFCAEAQNACRTRRSPISTPKRVGERVQDHNHGSKFAMNAAAIKATTTSMALTFQNRFFFPSFKSIMR